MFTYNSSQIHILTTALIAQNQFAKIALKSIGYMILIMLETVTRKTVIGEKARKKVIAQAAKVKLNNLRKSGKFRAVEDWVISQTEIEKGKRSKDSCLQEGMPKIMKRNSYKERSSLDWPMATKEEANYKISDKEISKDWKELTLLLNFKQKAQFRKKKNNKRNKRKSNLISRVVQIKIS